MLANQTTSSTETGNVVRIAKQNIGRSLSRDNTPARWDCAGEPWVSHVQLMMRRREVEVQKRDASGTVNRK